MTKAGLILVDAASQTRGKKRCLIGKIKLKI